MEKKLLITACILGFTAVLLGAFGAHGLKHILSTKDLISFETGVRYQFYHTFFLLFVSTTSLISTKTKQQLLYITTIGVLFFSGSIYLLALDEFLFNTSIKSIVFITPIGGFFLLGAWFLLCFSAIKKQPV